MNIEALEAALVNKQEISGMTSSKNVNKSEDSTSKEVSSYSWIDELTLLVSGGRDYNSSLLGNTSGLDFTRDNSGWRSGKFSFLNNISLDAISNTTVCSRYSKSSALNGELDSKYKAALSGVTEILEAQLVDAKNQLAKLEAEKKAREIEFNSGRRNLQSTIDSLARQIAIQKATVSDLEARIDTAKS